MFLWVLDLDSRPWTLDLKKEEEGRQRALLLPSSWVRNVLIVA